MSLVLTIFGFSIACVGVIGILNPRRLRELVYSGDLQSRFRSAVMTRIILGGLLIGASQSCRFPFAVSTLGVVALIAAITVYLLGERRFESRSSWWSDRPILSVRALSVVAFDLGLFLFHAPI